MHAGVPVRHDLVGQSDQLVPGGGHFIAESVKLWGAVPHGGLVAGLHEHTVQGAVHRTQVDERLCVVGLYLLRQARAVGQRGQLTLPGQILEDSQGCRDGHVGRVAALDPRPQDCVDVAGAGEVHFAAGVVLPRLHHGVEVVDLLFAPDPQNQHGPDLFLLLLAGDEAHGREGSDGEQDEQQTRPLAVEHGSPPFSLVREDFHYLTRYDPHDPLSTLGQAFFRWLAGEGLAPAWAALCSADALSLYCSGRPAETSQQWPTLPSAKPAAGPAVLTTPLILRTIALLSSLEYGKKEDASWPASSFR